MAVTLKGTAKPKKAQLKKKAAPKTAPVEIEKHAGGMEKEFTIETAKEIREKCQPEQVVELGSGLELWFVNVALLQEQSVNARTMTSDAFLQLSENIKRRGGLESLPLCALTVKGVEVVSGHHRIRAARKAEITMVWVLVDVTGLSRDAIKAKQLAHNSLSGTDNMDLVKQIFDSIGDVEARIEAFVEADLSNLHASVKLTSKDLDIEFDTKVVNILFLPAQQKVFKRALELLEMTDVGDVLLAQREEYDAMVAAMDLASKAYDITSTPTLFAKMAEVVSAHAQALLDAQEDAAPADPE